ncbi:MAG: hypothetical protein DRH93_18955 [Deltaproteobacteria bacterium]|nr:MAG: hypothetical protein DRH93_18955 [Deltaproteobacteria bacterium]
MHVLYIKQTKLLCKIELETALDDFPGSNTVYVDRGMPALVTENGTVFRPYNTVVEGVSAVPNNGRLSLVEGYYNDEIFTIDRPMFLVAPDGQCYHW